MSDVVSMFDAILMTCLHPLFFLALSLFPIPAFARCRSEDTSDWLLTDKVSSWPGTPADQGWRYLRQSLEQHDGPRTDYAYTKVVLETVMGLDRRAAPPPWLVNTLEVRSGRLRRKSGVC